MLLRAHHVAGRWDGTTPGFPRPYSKIKKDVIKQEGMHQRQHFAKQTTALSHFFPHSSCSIFKVTPQYRFIYKQNGLWLLSIQQTASFANLTTGARSLCNVRQLPKAHSCLYLQSCDDRWRKVKRKWLRFTSSMGIATWNVNSMSEIFTPMDHAHTHTHTAWKNTISAHFYTTYITGLVNIMATVDKRKK